MHYHQQILENEKLKNDLLLFRTVNATAKKVSLIRVLGCETSELRRRVAA